MVRPELVWKNQERNILNWVTIVLAAVIIMAYLSLWLIEGRALYLQLALVFFVWLGVFFTDYWQPILYLIMATIILITLISWIFSGLWGRPLGLIASLLNVIVLLLFVYLYYYEERVASPP